MLCGHWVFRRAADICESEAPFDMPELQRALVIVDLDLETSTSMIDSSTLILPPNPTKEIFSIYMRQHVMLKYVDN